MNRLRGRIALISGAGKGLGAAMAKKFAAEGATVLLGDILDEAGAQVALEITAAGGSAAYRHLDVTREEDWSNAIAEILQRYGRLDILVNNAAIVLNPVSMEKRTAEEWDRVMSVNLKGVFLGTKHALGAMKQSGGGSIVNISSLAGIGQSQITDAAYAASKGAVRILTKVTAAQYAQHGIRCNSVHPGPIATGMANDVYADPSKLQQRLTRVPLGRLGTVDEVAAGVVYLASDEASYTTGAELVIDGGALVQ